MLAIAKTLTKVTFVDKGQKVKYQTKIKINSFHNDVVSLYIPNE